MRIWGTILKKYVLIYTIQLIKYLYGYFIDKFRKTKNLVTFDTVKD